MADNVTLPGTGEVVATDDVSGAQYQYMKLADGTLGSTNKAVVDVNGRLNVATEQGKYTAGASVTAGNNSSAISTVGFSAVRIEMDTSAGTAPTVEVSADGSTNWKACQTYTDAGLTAGVPFVPSTSGQQLYADVRGFSAFRINNTAGSNTCTFNNTLFSSITGSAGSRSLIIKSSTTTSTYVYFDTPFSAYSGYVTTDHTSGSIGWQLQCSLDGVKWTNCLWQDDNGVAGTVQSGGKTINGDIAFSLSVPGATKFRMYTYSVSSPVYTLTLMLGEGPAVFSGAYITNNAVTVNGTITASNTTGNVASGSADSGNPVKVGGIVVTGAEAVASNAQRINTRHDKVGRPIVQPYQHRERVGAQATTITSSTSETTIISAQGSGVFADLSSLSITNSSASACVVTIRSVSGNNPAFNYNVPAGGGVVVTFPVPWPQQTANQTWSAQCSNSVASIFVNAVFILNQ